MSAGSQGEFQLTQENEMGERDASFAPVTEVCSAGVFHNSKGDAPALGPRWGHSLCTFVAPWGKVALQSPSLPRASHTVICYLLGSFPRPAVWGSCLASLLWHIFP